MGFKLRSGNGPLQFKQMGSSPVKQSDNFFAKNEMEGVEKANKEGKAVKIERLPLEPLEVKEDYNRGLSKSGQDQREALIKDKSNKKVDGGSNDSIQANKEGKGKNWLGRTGDKIKGAWGKYKEHVGSQEYYDTQDSINELANQLRSSSDTRPQIATNKGKINRDKKLAADALALSNKEKEENKVRQEKALLRQEEQNAQKLKDQEVDNSYKQALKEESDARRRKIEEGLVEQTQDSVENPNELNATKSFEEEQTGNNGNYST